MNPSFLFVDFLASLHLGMKQGDCMELIDSHAHIYLDDFLSDRTQVIENARKNGVSRIYLPNIDSGSIDDLLNLAGAYPDYCKPMMGLHPTSVNEDYEQELATVKQWLDKRSFAAIGEIGIDLYWDKTYAGHQQEAFKRQLHWAMQKQMPIVIHSRDSFDEIFQVIEQVNDGSLYGIFHSFAGHLDQARYIIDRGFKIGINGIVTFKNSSLDEVVREIDVGHLVVETDAPFLAPEPRRGRRNESAYVRYVCEKIAHLKNMDPEQVAAITTQNAMDIFLD
mgnify:CR=1 FL=1